MKRLIGTLPVLIPLLLLAGCTEIVVTDPTLGARCPAPTFNPPGGVYHGTQYVTLDGGPDYG